MPPDLQIYLLGSFRLLINGAAVPNAAWQKRKAKLLVQILALLPAREAHREELIEKLFPKRTKKRQMRAFTGFCMLPAAPLNPVGRPTRRRIFWSATGRKSN